MSQKRYYDYGTAAHASVFKEALSGLTGKGVLSGGDLHVSSPDRIVVEPIWFVTESPRPTETIVYRNNLIIHEDEAKQLLVVLSSAAANYSIVYRHTDVDVSGGSGAVLSLESGLKTSESIEDGLVVGYLVHPGGGVPLNDTMLISAPKARVQALASPGDGQYMTPPFHGMVVTYPSVGPRSAISSTEDTVLGQVLVLDNQSNMTASTTYLRWTYVCPAQKPGSISIDYVQDVGQTVSLDIQDTDGNVSSNTLGTSVLAGMLMSDFSSDTLLESYSGQEVRRRRLRIANGTYTAGKRFRVQATVQTAGARVSRITSVGHGPYRLPFAG